MNAQKKFARVRQTTTSWYAFYWCPNPYGAGFVPLKSSHTKNRRPRVSCLFRVERETHKLRKEQH